MKRGIEIRKGGSMRRYLLSALAFAACAFLVYSSVHCSRELSRTERFLREYQAYNDAQELYAAEGNIGSARYNLLYDSGGWRTVSDTDANGNVTTRQVHDPPDYPDPRDARLFLTGAIYSIGDLNPIVVRQLQQIHETLPDKNEIVKHQGRRVNNSTFAVERDLLQRQEQAVRQQADQLMEQVPQELRSRKSAYSWYLALSLIGAVAACIACIVVYHQ